MALFDCIICPGGWSQDQPGQGNCDECQQGQYQDESGELGCKTCSVGRYSIVTGSTALFDCEICPGGWSQDQPGQGNCDECLRGQYQDESGQSSCEQCSVGLFVGEQGEESCANHTQCAKGSYRVKEGNLTHDSVCSVCNAGYFSDNYDALICVICSFGRFQPQKGTQQCLPWRSCSEGQMMQKNGTSTSDVECVNISTGPSVPQSPAPKDSPSPVPLGDAPSPAAKDSPSPVPLGDAPSPAPENSSSRVPLGDAVIAPSSSSPVPSVSTDNYTLFLSAAVRASAYNSLLAILFMIWLSLS